jgi:regulator of sigma E protease
MRFYIYAIVFNLGILIFLHELGHYFAARATGVTVERFSVGFGPRILKFKRGVTEYALSLIPFGGYVKMAGMEQPVEGDEAELGPDTFLGKPLGLRAVIVAAGPTTNFLWAFVVMVGVVFFFGLPTLGEPVVGEVEPDSPAAVAGLVLGDRIVAVDGTAVSEWAEVIDLATEGTDGAAELTVVREGRPPDTLKLRLEVEPDPETGDLDLGFTAFVPPVVGDVMKGGPADRVGMLSGDRVVSIDGVAMRTWNEVGEVIHASAGETLTIAWERGGDVFSADVVPEEGEEPVGMTDVRTVGMIGIMRNWERERLSLWRSVTSGFRFTISALRLIADFFAGLVGGRVSAELVGGPIRVVQMASESARWGSDYFFSFMAYMSLNLFLINMLPLPILDGGHLLLMLLEKLRGRGLTERQLAVWQQTGIVFFVSLMVFLLVMDALKVG